MDLLWMDGHLVVAGPDSVAFVSPSPVGAVTTGLRFAPGAAPAVLGVPAREFHGQRVRLEDVWPAGVVARAEEGVAAAVDPGGALEQVVVEFGRGPGEAEPLADEIARRARAGQRVADIAPAVGMSARQLQRRSQDLFGYGPKLLSRILRLVDALDLASGGTPLATVAAVCGYADQAHLADDVRALAGTTLGGLGLGGRAQEVGGAGSGANRSIVLPSGSSTVA
jgi:AraC-like DNA-binding protein